MHIHVWSSENNWSQFLFFIHVCPVDWTQCWQTCQMPLPAQSSCWPLKFCVFYLSLFLSQLSPPILIPSLLPLYLLFLFFLLSFLPLVFLIGNFYFFTGKLYRYWPCFMLGALPVPLWPWTTILYNWRARVLQSYLRLLWQVIPKGLQGGSVQ